MLSATVCATVGSRELYAPNNAAPALLLYAQNPKFKLSTKTTTQTAAETGNRNSAEAAVPHRRRGGISQQQALRNACVMQSMNQPGWHGMMG